MEVSSLEFPTLAYTLEDPSQVGEVRRAAQALARQLGFSTDDEGRLALVVTEAATNTVRHGDGGCIFLQGCSSPASRGIELICADRGSGIENLARALSDGHSTGGSMGVGLGAIRRQADEFDLFSLPDKGTVLVARVLGRNGKGPAGISPGYATGVISLPKNGEVENGDAWAFKPTPDGWLMMVVDGLGHGPQASQASTQAIGLGRSCSDLSPGAILERMHAGLRSTRGAAAAVALLQLRTRTVRYAGIGNIAGSVVAGPLSRSMVSHNGTVGHEIRRIQEFTYPWPEEAVVIMHSDGLQTHWKLDAYPGLAVRHPAVIAAVLHRDFNRSRDDVTVLVAREIRS
jgi:anti-sigma regulatory factor (Ser/Thr protein kinase)